MTTTAIQLSEKRQELLRKVEAIVVKKRGAGAKNGQLVGYTDLINALRDPRRIVHYCPKCLTLASGATCSTKISTYASCDSGIFTVTDRE
ncbi:MAG: hypothetical protein NTX98_03895 [Candidatus Doudnabacteria bacterium]|nr:hypothetical protein [Candidatus Doudnabacteria bacterium]